MGKATWSSCGGVSNGAISVIYDKQKDIYFTYE
jgi:hypothetical protein